LIDVIGRRITPTAALRKPPLLPPSAIRAPAGGPCGVSTTWPTNGEGSKGLSISIFAGFPHADIPDAGFGIYVVTDGDQALADRLADQLADTAWTHRHEFIHTALPVRDAVAKASPQKASPSCSPTWPTTRAAGRAGDGTEVLRELIRVGARSAVVACIWDPRAVAECVKAGWGPRSRSKWAARSTAGTGRRCG